MSFFAKSKSSPRFREKHEKTYILPSTYGVAFGCICLLLFGIGFASANNAVYFLCFFMVALGSQSLVMTNRNTEKVRIQHLHVEDFFSDEIGVLHLSVHNPAREDIENTLFEVSAENRFILDKIKAGERRDVLVPLRMSAPGVQALPAIKISSEFPYHFARSWKKYYHETLVFVYPARVGSAAFAKAAFANTALEAQSLDDFKGHRSYHETDSPRSIDWRVTARVQKIMVKEFDPQNSRKITLRWEDCVFAEEALKKSQLSLWIDLAEKNNYDYSLELPGRRIAFGKGPVHKKECLRALL